MPKRECPTLESTLAVTGVKSTRTVAPPEQRAGGSFLSSSRYRDETRDNFTSHRSPGVHEFADEPATANGRSEKQENKQLDPGE